MAGFHPRIALDQTEGALENGALLLAAPARDLSDMPVPVPLSEAARIARPTHPHPPRERGLRSPFSGLAGILSEQRVGLAPGGAG